MIKLIYCLNNNVLNVFYRLYSLLFGILLFSILLLLRLEMVTSSVLLTTIFSRWSSKSWARMLGIALSPVFNTDLIIYGIFLCD